MNEPISWAETPGGDGSAADALSACIHATRSSSLEARSLSTSPDCEHATSK